MTNFIEQNRKRDWLVKKVCRNNNSRTFEHVQSLSAMGAQNDNQGNEGAEAYNHQPAAAGCVHGEP